MNNVLKRTYRDFEYQLVYDVRSRQWFWIIGEGSGLGNAKNKLEAIIQAEKWIDEFLKNHEI